jgi:hypothetical protein
LILAQACNNLRPQVIDTPTLWIEIGGFLYFLDGAAEGTFGSIPRLSQDHILRVISESDAPAIRAPASLSPIVRDLDSFESSPRTERLGVGATDSVFLLKDANG